VTSANWNWARLFAGKARGLCSSTSGLVPPFFLRGPTLLAHNVVLWISPPGSHRQESSCCWHEECPRWRRRRAATTAVPRFSTTDGPPRDHQPVPSARRCVVLPTSRHHSTASSISHGALKRHSPFAAADGVHSSWLSTATFAPIHRSADGNVHQCLATGHGSQRPLEPVTTTEPYVPHFWKFEPAEPALDVSIICDHAFVVTHRRRESVSLDRLW